MWRQIQQRMAGLSVILQENIAAIKLVKAFTREQHEAGRFEAVLRDVREMRLGTSRNMQAFMQAMMLSTSLSQVLALCFGALRVIDGDMTHRPALRLPGLRASCSGCRRSSSASST